MRTADLNLWAAMHDDCPERGCGQCITIEITPLEDQRDLIQRAATMMGLDLDAFIHLAIREKVGLA